MDEYIICITGLLVNSDIFFVLDVSASIRRNNFKRIKQFEQNFTKNITIGPDDNQVGTIIFSDNAFTVFGLNTHNTTQDVLDAIAKIPYHARYTNIKDALCRLVEGFQAENGARNLSRAVFRIAIVLTDGKSNRYLSDCNWTTIEEAAEEVHKLGVLVYVIAVGSFDYSELEKIASKIPGAVTKLDDFSPLSLEWGQEKIFDDVRKTGISCVFCIYLFVLRSMCRCLVLQCQPSLLLIMTVANSL